jgi:hypothetical protein
MLTSGAMLMVRREAWELVGLRVRFCPMAVSECVSEKRVVVGWVGKMSPPM